MMTSTTPGANDILVQLRKLIRGHGRYYGVDWKPFGYVDGNMLNQAADEIERLRAKLRTPEQVKEITAIFHGKNSPYTVPRFHSDREMPILPFDDTPATDRIP
jgi:hypothetical protein